MEDRKDAFGHALLDYYHGKEAQIVIERDDGNLDVSAEPEIYFQEYGEWKEYEQKAMKPARGRVLDLGSGAGRHSLYLQSLGHDVLALDNSPLAIEVVRSRGVQNSVVLPATQVSSKLGVFDTIIMMGNNFGLVGNRRRARWLFRRFHSITSGEAKIIATSLDPHTTDDPLHLAYHQRNRQKGRLVGEVRIRVRYRNYIGSWFDYLLASREEMEELFDDTGWQVRNVITSDEPVYAAIIEKV
ncbi:MAG TPA: methyltransferase domain-containing protein [candidate division Zixibacteria bacterium]|nr:methyltransferase domain-containing protein [candidate division Zixibacteria bacterium]